MTPLGCTWLPVSTPPWTSLKTWLEHCFLTLCVNVEERREIEGRKENKELRDLQELWAVVGQKERRETEELMGLVDKRVKMGKMGRKAIKELLDQEVLQGRRGAGVPLEGLGPGARKENEGIQGQLAMGRKGRKARAALKELEATQVLRKEGQCTLAGEERCAPVCLAQRRCMMAMQQEQGQEPEEVVRTLFA